MALPWKQIILQRTCLPVSGLIHHFSGLHIPNIRRKHSVPWYEEHLERHDEKKKKIHKKKGEEEKGSILRNPGVITVSKLSKEQLCEHLVQNIVYREGSLLAINKPQGLSISGSSEEFSLVSLLPDLQQLLHIKPELHVVKTASKESSGLVLLSTCHVTTKCFEDFYSQCRKEKKPFITFCAITLGAPDPAEGYVQVALKEEQIKGFNLVIPVMHPSKGSLERKEVKRTHTLYKVLDSAHGCSLLMLQPLTVFRDQLRVHCTLKFCPVLGDHTYSARVAKILGCNSYVPSDMALPQTQRVEEKILEKMHFSSQQLHRMPLHLHLHQLLMPPDPPGRYPAHLQAPPLPFFQQTMKHLGLKMRN